MEEYEALFARRFTAEDEEYQRRVQSGARDPPVLEGWKGARGGGRGGGGGGGERGGGGRHRDSRFQHGGHREGREWGGSPGWRSGPGGNQHNSPHQRPHYQRY